jgi:hypothetical protein
MRQFWDNSQTAWGRQIAKMFIFYLPTSQINSLTKFLLLLVIYFVFFNLIQYIT